MTTAQTNKPALPGHSLPGETLPQSAAHLPWGVLALGFAFFLIAVAAFIIRITTIGSDGANTDARIAAYRPESIEVYAYPNSPGPLRTGDRVVAVGDVTIKEWAQRLSTPNSDYISFAPDDLVVYRIVRNGRPLTLLVALKQMSFLSVFQARWGFFIFVFVSQLLGTWLLIRRPQVPAVRLFFIWSMLGAQMYLWALPLQIGDIVTGYGFWLGRFLVAVMALLFYAALLHFALLYPHTSGVVRRYPWVVPLIYLGAIALYLGLIAYYGAASRTAVVGLAASNRAVGVIAIIYLTASLATIFFQYRFTAPGPDRQRAKWAVLGGTIAILSGLFIGVITPLIIGHSGVDINFYGLSLLAFPISMTIAMWRYHLFDVDVIIRRTFFYTVVTAILVAAYLGAIIFLEAFFRQFTRQNSRPAVALATAAIMLLFNPIRVRVQASIDRLFYRTNYDTAQLLAHFANTCRDEGDLPKILAELEGIIGSSLQPRSIHIWLAPRRQMEEAAEE